MKVTCKNGWITDLISIHMKDRKNRSIALGFKNLLHCHEVARGPVSDSPSPTIQAAIRSGLSNTAPNECAREYPSSPPSLMEPGVSGATWLEIPPGKRELLTQFLQSIHIFSDI